jgi:hypothetical protein
MNMKVLEEYNEITGLGWNALNDKRIHAMHRFRLNTDTHLVYVWDTDMAKWIYTPMKTYAHTEFVADNMTIVVDVRPPEKEKFQAQPMLRDLSDDDFRRSIENAMEAVNDFPPPACLDNYFKAIAKAQRY